MGKFRFYMTKMSYIMVLLWYFTANIAFTQSVTITVNATQNKRLISPSIYGRNEGFDNTTQFLKDAGLRFARVGGGNNMSAYNWRQKLAVHPDWFNNVYGADWDVNAQKINNNFSNMQGMFAFQLLGRAASSGQHNFPDWQYMQDHPGWNGYSQNLAGGGTPDPNGGGKALVDGDINLFSKPWPADSSVAILNHWFGANGKGFNKNQFQYWSMDNEADVWNGTHDWAMPTLISASAFMDRYIALAKKAKALYPGIKLCGPVTTSEWQWYKWSNESIYINGRYYPWIEYFIKRLGDEYRATGIKLVDVIDIHNYPWYNNDTEALQLHRTYYDETYDYPGSNGIKTSTGGWDNSLTKQYIFKRFNDWLNEHFGANHGITAGLSEWSPGPNEPNLASVIYASHLGTFANNGVELFSPWTWFTGMWETLHLYSRNAKKYSVSSISSLENTVSAYTSVNENADSLTVMLVNRDMSASRTVTINLSNFNVANGTYKTLQLSSLPANETFISHTQNALKESQVSVNSNSLTLSVPKLSTTAILLTKPAVTPPQTAFVTFTNVATGLLIDGMGRTSNGTNAGQWSSSGSYNQQWTLETSGSYVRIKNRATGLYLDGMGRNSNGSLAGQWSNSGSSNQQWAIESYGSYSRIKNAATGLYIDGMYWSSNGSDLGQLSGSGSDAQQWTITSLKSVKENSEEISSANEGNCDIVLYPNPFISEISLRIDNPEQVTSIVVLDMLGKQVEVIDQATVKNIQAIGSSLKSGMYMVQVCSTDKTQSFKIIKK